MAPPLRGVSHALYIASRPPFYSTILPLPSAAHKRRRAIPHYFPKGGKQSFHPKERQCSKRGTETFLLRKKRQASRNELPTATQREVTHKVFPKLFKAVSPANTTSQRGLPTKNQPHTPELKRRKTRKTRVLPKEYIHIISNKLRPIHKKHAVPSLMTKRRLLQSSSLLQWKRLLPPLLLGNKNLYIWSE